MVPSGHLLSRNAFTLVEVLVAVSLVAVVGTIALLLLNSTRNVAAEVDQATVPASEWVRQTLEEELFHLLRNMPEEDWPRFELQGRQRLQFTTRLPISENDRRIPVICRYEPAGQSTQRVLQSPYFPTPVTNRLDRLQGPLLFEVKQKEVWVDEWPSEEGDASAHPPVLLRVTTPDTSFLLPIPAHLRMEGSSSNQGE